MSSGYEMQKKVSKILSPSLILYRIELTSFFSIFQRVTGVILSLFLLLIVTFYHLSCYFLSIYKLYYGYVYIGFEMNNVFFYTIFIFMTLMFFFHLFNGFRIFLQDLSLFWSNVLLKVEVFNISCFIILAAISVFFFVFWFRIFGLGIF